MCELGGGLLFHLDLMVWMTLRTGDGEVTREWPCLADKMSCRLLLRCLKVYPRLLEGEAVPREELGEGLEMLTRLSSESSRFSCEFCLS